MVAPEQNNRQSTAGRGRDLLRALVDGKVISQAQADLVTQDHENTGMAIDEILVARRWITEETLGKLAPWLNDSSGREPAAEETQAATGSYEENLKKYRKIMAEILGESSE